MSSRVHLFVVCMVVMIAFVAVSYLTDPADLRAQSRSQDRDAAAEAAVRAHDAGARRTRMLNEVPPAPGGFIVVDAESVFPEGFAGGQDPASHRPGPIASLWCRPAAHGPAAGREPTFGLLAHRHLLKRVSYISVALGPRRVIPRCERAL